MDAAQGWDVWFMHDDLVLGLLELRTVADDLQQGAHLGSLADSWRRATLAKHLREHLALKGLPSLDILHEAGTLKDGALVWIEQAFAFRGLADALRKGGSSGTGRATFSARLQTDRSFKVAGSFSAHRITSSSAPEWLSGTKRQFIVAYVEKADSDSVTLRPLVIASRYLRYAGVPVEVRLSDYFRLWPSMVDQWREVNFNQKAKVEHLQALKAIPERIVKEALAQSLGEISIANDWGGEQFDLWTDRLTVEGRALRTAFLLKGPGQFKPMTIAVLGKNGDQIDRIASSAADLIVVQHCHEITAPVENMLRVYATQPGRERFYMLVNGYATWCLLNHFGAVGA